jgi:hypothetical protein
MADATDNSGDRKNVLFLMQITEAYSFRNAMNIIKSETDRATMIISPTSIEISFINTQKSAVHKISINPRELSSYLYNIIGEDGKIVDECPIGFDTTEMFNTTKGVGRRDGLRLCWLEGDNFINVQPLKGSVKDQGRIGASFVKILTMEHTRYDVGYDDKIEPNVRVQSKDLAEICSQANTLKCSHIEITGKTSEISMRSIYPNGSLASRNEFGSGSVVKTMGMNAPLASNIGSLETMLKQLRVVDGTSPVSKPRISLNIVQKDVIQTVTVQITTVKALGKIHNISPSGTLVRFYFTRNQPIMMVSPIGTYGTYIICLR